MPHDSKGSWRQCTSGQELVTRRRQGRLASIRNRGSGGRGSRADLGFQLLDHLLFGLDLLLLAGDVDPQAAVEIEVRVCDEYQREEADDVAAEVIVHQLEVS